MSSTRNKRSQPLWTPPPGSPPVQLKLFNSLSRKKEIFVPQNGKLVTWYSCGPTVYDHAHMGHARSYISFDILRRVIADYFGYDVFYCMNITDIDDKIIVKARCEYLLMKYKEEGLSCDKVLADAKEAMQIFLKKLSVEEDSDKKVMLERIKETVSDSIKRMEDAISSNATDSELEKAKEELITKGKDVLGKWLDSQKGADVTENSIFADLPKIYEEAFHKDMKSLNVLPADVLTRVSEYIPENIDFVQNIIDNGYGYESNGSVYFETNKFDQKENHHYAKLVPEAFGDDKALAEGEGELTKSDGEKKNPADFALWKSSKPGEPAWDCPWGKGRPGWHLECSVMASSILGQSMDIHSGGCDLKFPHHDNEIAQSEAYFDNDNWVRYFLHTGHLTINGCKMSKSLKNFITIQDALKKYTSRQIRILYLLHPWKDTLDFGTSTMEGAIQYEKSVNEFFLTVKDRLRNIPSVGVAAFDKWTPEEVELNQKFLEKKSAVHEALCDNIDTPGSMKIIKELISLTHIYLNKCDTEKRQVNRRVVYYIASYITQLLKVFGTFDEDESIGFPQGSIQSADLENLVMPYLEAMAEFRDKVRQATRGSTSQVEGILKLCDDIRDEVLPNLGVRLEDKEGRRPVIKLVDREILLQEKEEQRKAEEAKRKEKEMKAAAQAEKKKQNMIPPSELFKHETEKYSEFDENGMPTLMKDGTPVTKSALKKLKKLYDAQDKKYQDYLKSQNR
ncbi:cysteine--tRNA ligase, cytoplasmic [Patella vulgata]|uniref:cysteine--tRNA ligase, cytoplasmic n=1 Tax=Patella vulgata TaxID=6465 RepID=UPI002180432C|nr:cysteine--tRNA ligase, cytoplasmic [Patella vulgata]